MDTVEKVTGQPVKVIGPADLQNPFVVGVNDIIEGIYKNRLWRTLGVLDVKRRYRRTLLGPFWASGHIGLYILCVGFIFSTLLASDRATYIPYLTTGFIAWMLVYHLLNEAPSCFVSASSLRQQIAFPYSMFIFQMIMRNLFVHAHNYVLLIPVGLVYGLDFNLYTLLIIPGYLLVVFNIFWISLILATLCARYRDVQQLISSVIQIFVFVTPIFYSVDQLSEAQQTWVLPPNLIYHLVVVLRAPLTGEAAPLSSYVILICVGIVGWLSALYFFGKRKHNIVFWIV